MRGKCLWGGKRACHVASWLNIWVKKGTVSGHADCWEFDRADAGVGGDDDQKMIKDCVTRGDMTGNKAQEKGEYHDDHYIMYTQ